MAEKLTTQQIVEIVNNEFDEALGAPGGDLSNERAQAWDYYLSKQFGDEDEDAVSTVVTSDVEEVVDGVMPSLLRIFTTKENLCSFDPVGPDDVEKAQQASDYVSHIFFKRNPAFQILYFGFFDALVQKSGIIKAWWDESEDVSTETYEGLSELEFLDLVADDELEIVERDEREDEDETGQKVTVHDVQFRRVRKSGRVRVDNVPPNEYRISADARTLNPCDARMVGHEREVTRDELIAMGFDRKKISELSPDGGIALSSEEQARRDKSDDQKTNRSNQDKSQDRFVLREAYIKIDADGDGRSELLQIFTVGDTLLSQDPADRQPFHMLCPAPLPHKHIGRSWAEKAMEIQKVNSTILRQTLGNLYHTNNPGHAVWEQGLGENTMDDLLTTKVGRIARFERPVGESYQPLVVPFTAEASFPMLEYFDRQKKDRTGISSDSEGLSPEALKNIQTSVLSQAVDLSKMKIETVARIFAETGLKTLFLHIHELVLKHQQKSDIVELRGQWVEVNPSEWRKRDDMTVNVGLGIGTREQNMLHLNAIWEKQIEMAQGGGMNLTVTPQNFYNTAVEFVRNANLKQPALFFTDPQGQPAPPPPDEQAELQKMQLEVKQREQKLDAERQQLNAAKMQLASQELLVKHREEMLKLTEKREERLDKYANENEKLRNHIAELQFKIRQGENDYVLKEAKTAAEIGLSRANEAKVRVEASNLVKEPPAPLRDPLEVEKKQAEIQRIREQARKESATIDKIQVETEAQRIENRAVEKGINEMLSDGESEETE